MKKLSSLLNGLRINTISIVILMITLVFAQQVNNSQSMVESEEEISSAKSDEEGDQEPVTTLDINQNIIASNAQFHMNHVFYEIMNIEQDEEEDNFENSGTISISDDYRKVLLSQVISPNAP